MTQSSTQNFLPSGSLVRPGPAGRMVRIALGAACLYALWVVLADFSLFVDTPYSTLLYRYSLLFAPLYIFNYVINIGYSKSWGRRPLIILLSVMVVAAVMSVLITGNLDSPLIGIPLTIWIVYFYLHLGLAFALSAILATPGCEMRSIPELIGRIKGKQSEEHSCPVSFLTKIDAWEIDKPWR